MNVEASDPRLRATAAAGLRAAGDRELAERLLADSDVKDAIERLERRGQGPGARRHLLATAIRLTREMAPDVHDIMDECRRMLRVEAPFETYVIPSNLRPDAIRADLPSRIDTVNRIVPPLRRAQVIRDLCVIACAGGRLDEAKLAVIRDIARAVGVDETVIACSTEVSRTGSCRACASGDTTALRARSGENEGWAVARAGRRRARGAPPELTRNRSEV